MATITLKDASNADVVYTEVSHTRDTITYVNNGANLLDRRSITLAVKGNGKTNRIVGKLSIPTVAVSPSTGLPTVQWTEVGSFDLGSVLVASNAAALDFMAQFASLAGNVVVKGLYTNGV